MSGGELTEVLGVMWDVFMESPVAVVALMFVAALFMLAVWLVLWRLLTLLARGCRAVYHSTKRRPEHR